MHRLKKLFSLGVPDVKRVDGATNFEGIKEARQQGETYINVSSTKYNCLKIW